MSTDVVIIGQGYVGLPLAVRAAECGLGVVGLDLDARTVAALNEGRSHVDDVSDHLTPSEVPLFITVDAEEPGESGVRVVER